MSKMTVKAAGIPAGNYRAKFVGTEPTTHIEYGPGLRWQFAIVGGEYAGEQISRITKPTPNVKNSAGKMLSALSGRPLKVNEGVDPDEFVDKEYLVTVEETASGASRVGNVFPANVG